MSELAHESVDSISIPSIVLFPNPWFSFRVHPKRLGSLGSKRIGQACGDRVRMAAIESSIEQSTWPDQYPLGKMASRTSIFCSVLHEHLCSAEVNLIVAFGDFPQKGLPWSNGRGVP